MVDRVVLGRRNNGTYGMDISRPGSNVHTAASSALAFSTNWSQAASVHQQGTISRGATVTFPALTYIPLVLIQGINGSNYMSGQGLFTTDVTALGLLPSSLITDPLYEVTKTSIRIMTTHPKYFTDTNSFSPGNVFASSYRYIIYRINGGV